MKTTMQCCTRTRSHTNKDIDGKKVLEVNGIDIRHFMPLSWIANDKRKKRTHSLSRFIREMIMYLTNDVRRILKILSGINHTRAICIQSTLIDMLDCEYHYKALENRIAKMGREET